MAIVPPRGRAKELGLGPQVEVAKIKDLPVGVPGDARTERPTDRGEGGRFLPGNSLARKGGHAKRGRNKLSTRLGMRQLPDGSAFRPYRASAVTFRQEHCAELARSVGGGFCGPGPSSFVASAALQLAWSRYLSDVAAENGDADMALQASRLADASRQNLLAAHELCAREAESRKASRPPVVDPLGLLGPNGGTK